MNEPNAQPATPAPNQGGVDPIQLQRFLQNMRDNQNLTMGIVGGCVGAILGAISWAVVAAVAHLNVGIIAIAVGFLTGFGVRYLGKGIDKQFGIVGAILAALGVALGNVLAVCVYLSQQDGLPFMDVIAKLNPTIVIEMLKIDFGPMDLFFYGIAIWAGYKYSIRQISEDEVRSFTGLSAAR